MASTQQQQSGGAIFFTSPGVAYNAVRAAQFEARMAEQAMTEQPDEHGMTSVEESGAFADMGEPNN